MPLLTLRKTRRFSVLDAVRRPEDWTADEVAAEAMRLARIKDHAVTLGGAPARDSLCWPFVTGQPCDCGGARAHLFGGYCGGAVAASLGGADRRKRCKRRVAGDPATPGNWRAVCARPHPAPGEVAEALEAWHAAHGRARVAVVSGRAGASRAAEPRRCTVPADAFASRLRRHAADSPYVAAFAAAPFFGAICGDEGARRLLVSKGAEKEISEAYAAARVVRRLARGIDEGDLVILDVCSGRGTVALLLAYLFPRARVVMFDKNDAMDLGHVGSRANLDYVELDVFGRGAAAALAAATRGRRAVVLGIHVCGALAPRVAALARDVDAVVGFALCPCCLKGSLGKRVKALAVGNDHYASLAAVLRLACERDAQPGADVALFRDDDMRSPKNAFIVVRKPGAGVPGG